ncbi:MAG: GIY-YIG nuclease family protein [Betaproteobacteria bacterium AqS2]|uniref:GIY-YIG nuclease family protein n=1 Tax=Candidatus Amphirhobacter heronislandensis TaxID=1732024 RepID=A0A930Y374_9GAMM|nr:GIY-YIG nuclease family protein [Betaproteobacteria bacterium AqS2]
MSGIVYILTNPAMPDLAMLGSAADEAGLRARVTGFSAQDAVPMPFSIHYARAVADADDTRQKLEAGISDVRLSSDKDFFRIAPEKATLLLQVADGEDVFISDASADDLEEQQVQRQVLRLRGRFLFSMVGIKPGAELEFSRDRSLKATVVDDRTIEFEGRKTSLSAAARQIMKRTANVSYSLRGPDFWMYGGEILTGRRLRMEDELQDDEERMQAG